MMKTLTLSLALVTMGAVNKPAEHKSPVEPAPLVAPKSEQGTAAQWTQRMLSRFHYKPQSLDDAMSRKIFKRYLDALDGEHWFLLQADVDQFRKYELAFDDLIRAQNLQPAFDLYLKYEKRVKERTEYARELLKGEFSFTVDEDFVYEREDTSWAKSVSELDDLWRRRVKNDIIRLKLAGKDLPSIRTTLDKRYKDLLIRIDDLDSDDVFQIFLNAYATAIDPHTNYLSPRSSENFQMQMRLSLEGIGALLRRDGDHTVIQSLVPGGPADKGKALKAGDRIVAVGQGETEKERMVDVVGWRTDDVVDLIRGKRNTWVRLEVLPAELGEAGSSSLVKILRDEVKLEEQAAQSRVIDIEEQGLKRRIGVIELPAFYMDFNGRAQGRADYRSSTRDVKRLIAELQGKKIDGLIVDLRNNGGGSLQEATDLTGLFIDQGPVVQVRDTDGRTELEFDSNPGLVYDGPLTVMINRSSASASEIFAGAIQDYGRGLILGERSFGKGTVQHLVDLDRYADTENKLGQLKMTVAQFFRVSGSSTQHKGVLPDIEFPSMIEGDDFGESSYDNALPFAEIAPAEYKASARTSADSLALLRKRYQQRSANDPEFNFLLADMKYFKEQRERDSVSLLLSARQTERDNESKRLAKRKQEREALGKAVKEAKLDDGLDPVERALAERNEDKKENEEPDVLLVEAAHIVADVVSLNDPKLRTAMLNPKSSAKID